MAKRKKPNQLENAVKNATRQMKQQATTKQSTNTATGSGKTNNARSAAKRVANPTRKTTTTATSPQQRQATNQVAKTAEEMQNRLRRDRIARQNNANTGGASKHQQPGQAAASTNHHKMSAGAQEVARNSTYSQAMASKGNRYLGALEDTAETLTYRGVQAAEKATGKDFSSKKLGETKAGAALFGKQAGSIDDFQKKLGERAAERQHRGQEQFETVQKQLGANDKTKKGKAIKTATEIADTIADIGIDSMAGPASLGVMAARAYGQEKRSALDAGATRAQAEKSAIVTGATEVMSEKIFGANKIMKSIYGKGIADEAEEILRRNLAKVMSKKTHKNLAEAIANGGMSILEEALEEGIAEGIEPRAANLIYGNALKEQGVQNASGNLDNLQQKYNLNPNTVNRINTLMANDADADAIVPYMQQLMAAGASEEEVKQVLGQYLEAQSKVQTPEYLKVMLMGGAVGGILGGASVMMDYRNAQDINAQVDEAFGAGQEKQLIADVMKNAKDEAMAARAQALSEEFYKTGTISSYAVREMAQAQAEAKQSDYNKVRDSYTVAEKTMQEKNLISPAQTETLEYANQEAKTEAQEVVRKMQLPEGESDALATALANFATGTMTVEDISMFNVDNAEARTAFEEMTGLSLESTIKDNAIATNNATKDFIAAHAADNLVKVAEQHNARMMAQVKDQMSADVTRSMGAAGQAVYDQVADSITLENAPEGVPQVVQAHDANMLFKMYYQAGRNNSMSVEELDKTLGDRADMFSSELKIQAYEAGLEDKSSADAKAQAKGDNVSTMAAAGTAREGTLTVDVDEDSTFTASQGRMFRLMAQSLGTNIKIVSTLDDGSNGFYQNNTITLAADNADRAIEYVFAHELTHHIKKFAPQQYNNLENLVRENWEAYSAKAIAKGKIESGMTTMAEAVKRKQEVYLAHAKKLREREIANGADEKTLPPIKTLSEEDALEEIIADATYEMLNDRNFVKKACDQDIKLGEAILDAVRTMAARIRDVLTRGKGFVPSQNAGLLKQLDILEEFENLWLEGLAEARRNKAAVGLMTGGKTSYQVVDVNKVIENTTFVELENGEYAVQIDASNTLLKNVPSAKWSDVIQDFMMTELRNKSIETESGDIIRFTRVSANEPKFGTNTTKLRIEASQNKDYAKVDEKKKLLSEVVALVYKSQYVGWQKNTNHSETTRSFAEHGFAIRKAKAAIVDDNGTVSVKTVILKTGINLHKGSAEYGEKFYDITDFSYDEKEPYSPVGHSVKGYGVPHYKLGVDGSLSGMSISQYERYVNAQGSASVTADDGDSAIARAFKNANSRKSLPDSEGNELSEQQQMFFADSKVRDDQGRLLKMYHGTPSGTFNTFRRGSYFTPNKEYAARYQNEGASSISTGKVADNPKIYEVYLNITKPFDLSDPEARRIYIDEYIKGGNAMGINPYLSQAEYDAIDNIDWTEGEDLRDFLQEEGYDYDGIIMNEGADGGYGDDVVQRGDSYMVFESNQVKNVDNLNPTDSDDIRFQVKAPVEQDKDMIAWHNMSVDGLEAALNLGGLAMPSFAVKPADKPHLSYGPVSILARRESIEPSKDVRIFGGDAWTPDVSDLYIENKINEKALGRVEKTVEELLDGVYLGHMGLDEQNVTDKLNRWNDPYHAYGNTPGIRYAYLKNLGEDFELPTREKKLASKIDNEGLKYISEHIAHAYGGDIVEEMYLGGGSYYNEHPEEVDGLRQVANDYYEEKYGERFKNFFSEKNWGFGTWDDIVRGLKKYRENGIETEVDQYEANYKLQEYMKDNNLEEGYRKWLDDLFDGVVEKKGIRNDKETFTPSGNRRSFDALHWDYTLSNLVLALKKKDQQGKVNFLSGPASAKGAALKDFKTIEDVRASLDRIIEAEELEGKGKEMYDAFQERVKEVASIVNPNDMFNGAEDIAEILARNKTEKKILSYLRKEFDPYYHYDDIEGLAHDIYGLIDMANELPMEYFEAKIYRAFPFSESAAVVVPDDTPSELISRLEKQGVNVMTYEKGNDEDRVKKVNSVEDVRFSISDQEYLDAVERGDMETAQKMVDEAARDAGWSTTKYYHGTGSDFYKFDKSKIGQAHGSSYGEGFYFSDSEDYVGHYNDGRVISAYLKINNPFEYWQVTKSLVRDLLNTGIVDFDENNFDDYFRAFDGYDTEDPDTFEDVDLIDDILYGIVKNGNFYSNLSKMVQALGYDAIVAGDETVVFEPSQIKSADPVTYDDNGNVIPLSQRFNQENEDIRWSIREGGYDGRSMSNRARKAYAMGEKPMSKWTKDEIIEEVLNIKDIPNISKLTKQELADSFLSMSSWHHTGAFYNRTVFYSVDQGMVDNFKGVDAVVAERKRTKKTEAEREAERSNAENLKVARNIYQTLSVIRNANDKPKTLKPLVKKVIDGSIDLNAEYQKALDKIRKRDSNKVDQWRKLGEDHWRTDDVRLFDNDIESYAVKEYANDIPKSNADIQKLKEHVAQSNTFKGTNEPSYLEDNELYTEQKFSIKDPVSQESAEDYMAENQDEYDELPVADQRVMESRGRREAIKEEALLLMDKLNRDTRLTHGEVLNKKSVSKQLREFVKEVMVNSDARNKNGRKIRYKQSAVEQLTEAAYVMWKQIQNDQLDEAVETAYDAALQVVDDLDLVIDDAWVHYKDVRDYLRNTAISIPEENRDSKKYNEWRKANMGRIKVTNDGRPIDEAYSELSELWPELFSPEIINPEEQAERLSDALDEIKPYAYAYSSEEADMLAKDIATDFVTIVYAGEAWKSYADKSAERYAQKTAAMKTRHQEAMRKLRKEKNDKYNRAMAEAKRNLDLEKEESERKLKEAKVEADWDYAEKDLADRMNEGKKRAKDRRKRSESKRRKADHRERMKSFGKIKKNYEWLTSRLLNPTDEKHIPELLRQPLAEFLQQIDLQTERSKKLEKKYGEAASTVKMHKLRSAIEEVAKNGEGIELDEGLMQTLKELADGIDDRAIDELTNEEIQRVDILFRALKHSIQNYNKFFGLFQELTIHEAAQKCFGSWGKRIERKGPRSEYSGLLGMADRIINESQVTPRDFFEHIGGGVWDLYKGGLRKGLDTQIKDMDKLRKMFGDIFAEYGNKKKPGSKIESWIDSTNKKTFNLENGQTVTMTPAQIMSLYASMMREQAVGHILGGGITVTTIDPDFQTKNLLKQGANAAKKALGTRLQNNGASVHVSYSDCMNIIKTLTEEQKAVTGQLLSLLQTVSAWGNEASMAMYGYRKFTEANYFPIKSSDNWLNSDYSDRQSVERIKNFGFTKGTVVNANNPIVIDDIFSVVADHCNKMTLYHAYAPAISDMTRLLNYKTREEDGTPGPSVKSVLETAYGKQAMSYINKFMSDVQNQTAKRKGGFEHMFNKVLSNSKKAAIAGSLSVALQQPTAIVRALAVMNPIDFRPTPGAAKRVPQNMREVKEHCPIALWKSWGFSQTDLAADMKDIMMNREWNKLDAITMELYGKLDDFTWSCIWDAVKNETRRLHKDVPEGSEEFWRICGERAAEVFDGTQVVDSPFHRSDVMRSQDMFIKTITSFMAEPTRTFNMIRSDVVKSIELNAEGKHAEAAATFGRMATVFVANAAAVSAAKAIADALRAAYTGDDKDDGPLWEIWLEKFYDNFKGNVNPLGLIPYFGQAFSDYGFSSMATEYIGDFISDSKKLFDLIKEGEVGSENWWKTMLQSIKDLSYVTGLPIKNVLREFEMASNMFGLQVFADSGEDTIEFADGSQMQIHGESWKDKLINHIPLVGKGDDENYGETPTAEYDDSGLYDMHTSWFDNLIGRTAADKAEKQRDSYAKDALEAAKGKTGEDYYKSIYASVCSKDKVKDGVSLDIAIQNGDFRTVKQMRRIIERTGNQDALDYFDEQTLKKSKTAFKKTIGPIDSKSMAARGSIYQYLSDSGMSHRQIVQGLITGQGGGSKCDTAKAFQEAYALGEFDKAKDLCTQLRAAGIEYEDFVYLASNAYRVIKASDFATGEFEWPIDQSQARISSHVGHRSSPGGIGSTNHKGIDIAMAQGSEVRAADGGKVVYSGYNSARGKYIVVDHGNGTETLYQHLSWYEATKGQVVKKGQYIGNVGSTGHSTGPHLHMELHVNGQVVDPEAYLPSFGSM